MLYPCCSVCQNFLFQTEKYSIMWMGHVSVHPLMDPWVASAFWLLWSWMYRYLSGTPGFDPLEYILRNGAAGSYGESIFVFSRNCHPGFPQRLYRFRIRQQGTRVPVSPRPRCCSLFHSFLIVAVLMGVRWFLVVVLICISLMISDVLRACGTCVYLCGNILCPFLNQVVFLWLGCEFSVYSDIHPLSDTWFVNIFFHSVGRLFTLLLVSFDAQIFNLHEAQFSCSLFCYLCRRCHCQAQCHEAFALWFLLRIL